PASAAGSEVLRNPGPSRRTELASTFWTAAIHRRPPKPKAEPRPPVPIQLLEPVGAQVPARAAFLGRPTQESPRTSTQREGRLAMTQPHDLTPNLGPVPLPQLLAQYLERQRTAHDAGLVLPDVGGEVELYDAGPAQAVEPRLAWDEAGVVL